MATTPVYANYLVSTAGSIEVDTNLAADFRENLSITFSGNNYSTSINNLSAVVAANNIEINSNQPSDFKENVSIEFSGTSSSPVQNSIFSSRSSNSIEISTTIISSPLTTAEKLSTNNLQVWSVG